MPGLGFWLRWVSEHCAPRPLAQCIWTQGQRRGKVVIFQMNVSELTWLPFLEPLITAEATVLDLASGSFHQRGLRNGYFQL